MDTFFKFLGAIIGIIGLGVGAASFLSAASLGEGTTSGVLILASLGWSFGGIVVGALLVWMGKVYERLKGIHDELQSLNSFD